VLTCARARLFPMDDKRARRLLVDFVPLVVALLGVLVILYIWG
jgi:hypothetical protein